MTSKRETKKSTVLTYDDPTFDVMIALSPEAIDEALASEIPKSEESQISLSMYAAIKGIPASNVPGMAAYTDRTHATRAEWETIFTSY